MKLVKRSRDGFAQARLSYGEFIVPRDRTAITNAGAAEISLASHPCPDICAILFNNYTNYCTLWKNHSYKIEGHEIIYSTLKGDTFQHATTYVFLLIQNLLVVCKVVLRTIILRDNIIRKHWWTINNIIYMLQLWYNKSDMVIYKYFYLLIILR